MRFWNFLVLGLLLLDYEQHSTLRGADQVGTLQSEVSVNSHGAADCSIPIISPPGRSGLQPHVVLSYSSASGNGVAGLGFSISTGLPRSIMRGRSILARDGVAKGVVFDSSDKLYLDGKRLVCVSGPEGQPGSNYRTEVDSFVTVAATGTGTVIETLVVTDKMGTKMYFGKYGAATDGYQPGIIRSVLYPTTADHYDTLAYNWALKHVEDAIGNSVDLTYTDDNLKSEFVLSTILYTANQSQGIAAHNRISFSYKADRTDSTFRYVSGRRFCNEKRLESITSSVYESGAWKDVSTYTPSYQYSSDSARLQMTSIKASLWDSSTGTTVSLPPTSFSWTHWTNVPTNPIAPATAMSLYSSLPSNQTSAGYKATAFGDFNGDGKEDFIDARNGLTVYLSGNGENNFAPASVWLPATSMPAGYSFPATGGEATGGIVTADLNGDGFKDIVIYMNTGQGIKVTPCISTGTSFIVKPSFDISSQSNRYAFDTAPGSTNKLTFLRTLVKGGVFARFSAGDFLGDGRDEILVHGYDGYRYLLAYNASTGVFQMSAPMNAGSPGAIAQVSDWWAGLSLANVGHFWSVDWPMEMTPMPMDFNGDGVLDYFWGEKTSFLDTDPNHTPIHSVTKWYKGSLNDSNGNSFPGAPQNFYGTGSSSSPIPANSLPTVDTVSNYTQMCLSGDFNGDGLSDIITRDHNSGWSLRISKGVLDSTNGNVPTTEVSSPLPATFIAPDGEILYTASRIMTKAIWDSKYQSYLYNIGGTDPLALFLVQADSSFNTFVMDVNHDGLSDLVWYVEYKQVDNTGYANALASVPNRGWWVAFSSGTGFMPPQKLTGNIWEKPEIAGQGYDGNNVKAIAITTPDLNGDGIPDWIITGSVLYYEANSKSLYAYGRGSFGDLLGSVTNGMGSATSIYYKAAKDDSIYTPGAPVSYPIREVRGANPIVSDISKDSGGDVPAKYSYQYSGNRSDMSGRGPLGFHSFVTIDCQKSIFKYQFFAQSFPITGFSAREQICRFWSPDSQTYKFRYISSHDNTVVFDQVANFANSPIGTVYPFISKAVESLWEDGTSEHILINDVSNLAKPKSETEVLFSKPLPSNPFIVKTASSLFDAQASVQTSLPGGYTPSDMTVNLDTNGKIASYGNSPAGTSSYSAFNSLSFPKKIRFGNLISLTTDYGDNFTETVATTFHDSSIGLAGLVKSVAISASLNGVTSSLPTKSIPSYWSGVNGITALPLEEDILSGDSRLDTKTMYTRDGAGRILTTSISGQEIGTYTTGTVLTYDSRWDTPTSSYDAYGVSHTSTVTYDICYGRAVTAQDINGIKSTIKYDALGRMVSNLLRLSEINSTKLDQNATSAFIWDTSVTLVPDTKLTSAISLKSAYRVEEKFTGKPNVTTYYDRLGRPLRTSKQGFASQVTNFDTYYDISGRVVAVSLPYVSGSSPLGFTTTSYDNLGRVDTVAAPLSSSAYLTTKTSYFGRATKVSTKGNLAGDSQPTIESTTKLADAKGRIIKIWNAYDEPSLIDPVTGGDTLPSIKFDLDPLGRMVKTTLVGSVTGVAQVRTIGATYDALGNQTSLDDPDKGLWTYKNDALGRVIETTDSVGNFTKTTYDWFNRPLSRVTKEPNSGPIEFADWYYYDTSRDSGRHTVSIGNKGWLMEPEREQSITKGAPGYAAKPNCTVHYYDNVGNPEISVSNIDDKWYYQCTSFDSLNRPLATKYYWRPLGSESAVAGILDTNWISYGYTYAYDAVGFVLSVKDDQNRLWWQADPTTGYDYLGRPLKFNKGGITTTKGFDPYRSVLTTIKSAGFGSTIQDLTYSWDDFGNLSSRNDFQPAETFTYDKLNRLTNSSYSGGTQYLANGNVSQKSDVNGVSSTPYSYDAPAVDGLDQTVRTLPHAVANAFGFSMIYDQNGNMKSRTYGANSLKVKMAGFDKPRWMIKTNGASVSGSEFQYNASRSRVMHLDFNRVSNNTPDSSGYTLKRIYAYGGSMEVDYSNTQAVAGAGPWTMAKYRVYVPSPDGIAGAREFDATTGSEVPPLVYHYDHIGSVQKATVFGSATIPNGASGLNSTYAYDAWGQRRNPASKTGAPVSTGAGGPTDVLNKGFTGHEMLDNLGLIHMNGRIYDPLIGRFLSADIFVQDPSSLQSYNRYSYVFNNPLSFVDPSGFVSGPHLTTDAQKEAVTVLDKLFERMKSLYIQDSFSLSLRFFLGADQVDREASYAVANGWTPSFDEGVFDKSGTNVNTSSPANIPEGSVVPSSGGSTEDIFRNITFSKDGILWWEASDSAVEEAKKQFKEVANSKNSDGTPTQAALNIRKINEGSTPVNIKVVRGVSKNDFESKVIDGVLVVRYNPNYCGNFDGVDHDGASILAHELGGHGFQKTVDMAYWTKMDKLMGRPETLTLMEFDAVRVENSYRASAGMDLRRIYTRVLPEKVPSYDKYVK